EPSEGHTADDKRRREQGRKCGDESHSEGAPTECLVAAHSIAPRAIIDIAHHEGGHHETRYDAAEKERADRDIPHHSVDHERQRWRNDWPECGGGRRNPDREFGIVTVILH